MSSKFSQPNDALTQNQVISWLNDAGLADGPRRADLLRKAIEVLLHHAAAAPLLETHIDVIVSHAVDKHTEVKKKVIGFIEEISKLHPQHLPKVVGQLRLLVSDDVVAVAKRSIQAASIVYRHALMWLCHADASQSANVQIVWKNLSELKLLVLNMIDSDNEGIRTHSIKFLEEVVILQSSGGSRDGDEFSIDSLPPPPWLPFIDRRALHDEAEHIFTLLIKFHNSAHISSVNLMACMASLCSVARARPRFLPRVARALQALHATLPPTLSASQVNSVRKHLRMLLLSLIKHPSSNEMVPTLIQLLADTGMTQQEIAKAIPRERRSKRLAEIKNGDGPSKRSRTDSPLALESQGSDSNSRGEFTSIEEDNIESFDQPTVTVTEESLMEGLENVENVVRLVTSTLVDRLPAVMPPDFSTLYTPIPNAGSILQRRIVARMLYSLIKGEVPVPPPAPVPPPVAPVPKPETPPLPPEPVPPPDRIPLLKDDDEKMTLKNAVAKLQESTKADRLSEVASGFRKEEARAEFLKSEAPAPPLPVPPTPTVPKLKHKVKLLKLAEITRPIPKEIKERLVQDAVKRILNAEADCIAGGAAAIRNKFLALFASGYGSNLRDMVLDHVLADPIGRLDLAMHWLYEEYAYMQGFARHPATLGPRSHEKHDYSYNRLLCELAAHLLERAATGDEAHAALLRRVYCEAPLVTDDAAELLRLAAAEPSVAPLALDLVDELCVTRVPRAHKYVPALLAHCLSENEATREQALTIATKLHLRGSDGGPYAKLRATIEKHALLQMGFVALESPPPELMAARPRQPWDERLYKICVGLIMAIFPDNEDLIVEIGRVYGASDSTAKRVLLRALDAPLRTALRRAHSPGPHPAGTNPPPLPRAAAALLAECPRGADTLLTRLVHMLTDLAPPSEELVRRVRELYATRINDVRFLIPVLTGLSKQEILAALPKLIKLNPAVVKEVFNKLLGLNSNNQDQPPPVSPIELLVALHLIDPNQADLKYIIKATALCFAEKQIYTQEVVGSVVQRLSEQSEVPVLMLRSVLQALTLYPALQPLVLNVLQLLLEKEVWNNKVAWEGWVKCCERLAPRTGFLIVSLPARAIQMLPPTLIPPLRDYVDQLSAAEQSALPSHILAAAQQHQMAPQHVPSIVTHQEGQFPPEPLPPGME